MTAPTLITPPVGGAMMAGLGVQAVVNEPIAISPARGTQGLRTSRDYVPVLQRRLGNPLTNMLIAGPVEAGCRLNYAIGSAGRVSQVVRQRSAKPPPRVRIPHSPPIFEYDLTPASPNASRLTATLTAAPRIYFSPSAKRATTHALGNSAAEMTSARRRLNAGLSVRGVHFSFD